MQVPHGKLAVHGYAERSATTPSSSRTPGRWRRLLQRARAFIGVDAPDFNLGLEARLKRAGIKSIHFVCPSIWAWRGGRVKRIARRVDHVLCLFPFEPELRAAHGIAATFVGHPLADVIPLQPPRAEARQRLGLARARPVVALLPGSRRGEIQPIAPPFLQAASLAAPRAPAAALRAAGRAGPACGAGAADRSAG